MALAEAPAGALQWAGTALPRGSRFRLCDRVYGGAQTGRFGIPHRKNPARPFVDRRHLKIRIRFRHNIGIIKWEDNPHCGGDKLEDNRFRGIGNDLR
jgi:hypothetical protein